MSVEIRDKRVYVSVEKIKSFYGEGYEKVVDVGEILKAVIEWLATEKGAKKIKAILKEVKE